MRDNPWTGRWPNVIKLWPLNVGEPMMDFLNRLPKELQIPALGVRSRAGQTGFCSLPFRDDAFDRFEAYCLTKLGWTRDQRMPDEAPTVYRAAWDLDWTAGYGVEHLPGLVQVFREAARGSCRCPAAAPGEVDIVHVRWSPGGGDRGERCLALRAQALDRGWALRLVTARPPVPSWLLPWVPAPLSLHALATLLVAEPASGSTQGGAPSAATEVGLVRGLWVSGGEAGLRREEAVASVVVSSICYPTLHVVLERKGRQWIEAGAEH